MTGAPPPPAPPPPPPGGYGAPPPGGYGSPPPGYGGPPGGYGAPPPQPSKGGGNLGLWIVLGVVAVVALVAVGLVAFGGDDNGGGGSGTASDIALDELEPALLTEDDVGDGFFEVPFESDDGDDSDTSDFDVSEECRVLMDSMESAEDDNDEVGAAFEGADDASVEHTIGKLSSGEPTLDDIRAALDQCGTMAYEQNGANGEITMEAAEVSGIGDEALGIDIAIEIDYQGMTIEIEAYGVLSARDGIASSVYAFGGLDEATMEGTTVDSAWVEELAAIGDQRVADVLSG